MRYETLKNAIEEAQCDLSDVCTDILDNVLNMFDESMDDIDVDDVYDILNQECDDYFIYYDDAWDYLRDNSITDFDDAVANGCTNVCAIACWYAYQEISDNLELYMAEQNEEEDED